MHLIKKEIKENSPTKILMHVTVNKYKSDGKINTRHQNSLKKS